MDKIELALAEVRGIQKNFGKFPASTSEAELKTWEAIGRLADAIEELAKRQKTPSEG